MPKNNYGSIKWFLLRALRICLEKYLAQEIKSLTNAFAENGHSITVLEKDMNSTTSVKEKGSIDTTKNDKIVKLPWVPKLGPKLRKEF